MSTVAGKNWFFEKSRFYNFLSQKTALNVWKHRAFVRCFLCCIFHQHILVRVERFERSASWTQIKRATNCAIPGYLILNHYSTKFVRLKDFSVCGHLCGQSRFCAVFGNRGKNRYCPCCKALWRFVLPCPGYRHGTPKPGAIPTSLYPDTTHYYSRSKCACPVLYIAFCILWNPAF